MKTREFIIVLLMPAVLLFSGILFAQEAAETGDAVHAVTEEEGADIFPSPSLSPQGRGMEGVDREAAVPPVGKEEVEVVESANETDAVEKELTEYDLARRLYKLRRYDDAAELCERLLMDNPGNKGIEVLMYKAQAALLRAELAGQKLKQEVSHDRAILTVDRAVTIPVPEEDLPRPQRDELVIRIESDLPAEEVQAIQEKLNQRVSVDLINADLSYILNLLFRSCGINIIANQEALEGHKLTIHVQDFPLKDILKYIARNEGISYTITPDAVWVTTPKDPLYETRAVYLKRGLTDVGEAAESESSDLEKLLEVIPDLVPGWPEGGKIYLDRKENILYLKSTPETLSQAIKLVETLDVTPTQVLIEVRFVEIGKDDIFDLGIDWNLTSPYVVTTKGGEPFSQVEAGTGSYLSTPPAGPIPGGFSLTYTGVLTDPQFRAVLHALSKIEKTNTLSAPTLIALNNYTATIEIEDKIVYVEGYEVTYPSRTLVTGFQNQAITGEDSRPTVIPKIGEIDVGIKLKITPSVGADKETVTLTIEPEITDLVREEKFDYIYPGAFGADAEVKQFTRPIISKRTLLTKMTIKDGSTVVIGGMMKNVETKTTRRVPGLSRIPLIGRLFRRDETNVEKKNLMIFVTANVLSPGGGGYVTRRPSIEENEARFHSVVRSNPGVEIVEDTAAERSRRGNRR